MPKLIPAAERIIRARKLIQQAYDYPVPDDSGRGNFSYVANVKDLLRQSREMIKFITMQPSVSAEMKDEVKKIFAEIEKAEKEILHP